MITYYVFFLVSFLFECINLKSRIPNVFYRPYPLGRKKKSMSKVKVKKVAELFEIKPPQDNIIIKIIL